MDNLPFDCLINDNIDGLVSYLEAGNINVVDDRGCSLLCYAIKLHRNEIFKLLLKNYIRLDLKDCYGNTAFHYAVIYNRLGYLKMLLKSTGNPLEKNNQGRTPFYIACLYGREEMIELYLESFPYSISEKDMDEESILMALVRSKELKLLKKYGSLSNIEEENHFGDSLLSIAVKIGCFEIASYLLSNHAFVNHKNHIGETPLFYAVRNEDTQMISILLQYGACLDCKNHFGETIFDFEMLEKTKALLDDKMQFDVIRFYAKKYPLHYSIYIEDQFLIEKYLQLRYAFIEDCFGYTPLNLSNYYDNEELLKGLKNLEKQAHMTELRRKK
ncbi:MAG: ankyrin repeat domain-containing protein [Anaeroplasmataceae bacterium]|nr:ankyrin repeat domain-containing protein [Anaeroplasmataceae bacterium]